MKMLIFVCLTVGGVLGAWLGGKLDGGFGFWSAALGLFIGPFLGIWVGYKLGKSYLE